jgi:hypothetical protein
MERRKRSNENPDTSFKDFLKWVLDLGAEFLVAKVFEWVWHYLFH